MNSRNKFLSVMNMNNSYYKNVEVPKVEWGYWAGTIRKWSTEGLVLKSLIPNVPDPVTILGSKKIIEQESTTIENIQIEPSIGGEENVRDYFNLDDFISKWNVRIYSPMFPIKVLQKRDDYVIYTDYYGVTYKNSFKYAFPIEVDYPVKDWATWEEYKSNYIVNNFENRLPKNWPEISKNLKERDFPLNLGGPYACGFYGFPKTIMGFNNYMMALYDEPELIFNICDTILQFLINFFGRITKEIKIDCINIWEDMAGKQGMFISPESYKKFVAPYHKALVNFAKDIGINIIVLDNDGFIEDLIPLILDSGITGIYPVERAAGNDLLRIRKNFPDLQIMGGIDKRILFKESNKKLIDDELEITKIMLKKGKYIPHIDHMVSSDCTWGNFSYYRKKLNHIIDSL